MKRIKSYVKLVCSIVMSITILFAMLCPVCATSDDVMNSLQAEKVMISFGYPEDMIDILNSKDKIKMAKQMIAAPESVQVDVISVPIDELYWIELIANTTDEELLNMGLSAEDIQINRDNIRQISFLSDAELRDFYGKSEMEIKLLKLAADKKENYKQPRSVLDENKVTISEISTTTLTYVQTVISNTRNTNKPVSYSVNISFEWKNHPTVTFLKDKIGVNWGCDLDSMAASGSIRFTGGNTSSTRATEIEVVPNQGLIFTFWQRAVNGFGWDIIKSGTIGFIVYQDKKQNLSTKIVSRYGHGIASVTGGDVSFGGPSVSFSTGYDQSAQHINDISV